MNEVRKRPLFFPVPTKGMGSPTERMTLQGASSELLRLTRRTAVLTIREARLSGDTNREAYLQRRSEVRDRLSRLYTFWNDIEGKPSRSKEEALQRFETQTALLVHPSLDAAMTDALSIAQLPDTSVICILGSMGNGAAQVSTLAARDRGFDGVGRPDADMLLLSGSDISEEQREKYQKKLDEGLGRHNISSCEEHNIGKEGINLEKAEEHIMNGDLLGNLKGLDFLFYPAYPQETAAQMRSDFIDKLILLGERDAQKHDYVLRLLELHRRRHTRLSRQHFNGDVREEQFRDVSNYFRERIMGVFMDLLNTTRPTAPETF